MPTFQFLRQLSRLFFCGVGIDLKMRRVDGKETLGWPANNIVPSTAGSRRLNFLGMNSPFAVFQFLVSQNSADIFVIPIVVDNFVQQLKRNGVCVGVGGLFRKFEKSFSVSNFDFVQLLKPLSTQAFGL